ncbi:hypothetical protein GCM10007989_03230 [Devosia pacifica]|uniref:Bacterial sugar transferase domain-containing protein n=1 Tax=Devosia pacifica TaxID=1335967 RepID=A0A918RUZ5_9HYPH|nr:exopolysaccharide biosynthesis polyprenyl glycosylphosphotransferase [Devosia pacifica]GHA12159.1 hypothetical protein GCM10007989_03230 [Devosia pacifica]
MALSDFTPTRVQRRAFSAPAVITDRLVLCLSIAALESLAVFALFGIAALSYHVVVLHQTVATFDSALYVTYGALGAAIYAGFAAYSASGLLEIAMTPERVFRQVLSACTTSVALVLLAAFLVGQVEDFSRASLTLGYLASLPVMSLLRLRLHGAIANRISQGQLSYESVGIIGTRQAVSGFLGRADVKLQGHRVESALYLEEAQDAGGEIDAVVVTEFAKTLLKGGTDQIILVGDISELDKFAPILTELRRYALNLLFAPSLNDKTLKFIDVITFGPNNVLRFVRPPMNESSVLLKRTMDLVLAAIGLFVLMPLFALVALAIKLETRGPVLYRQARRGFNGEPFLIWKFRSMRVTESGYAMQQAQRNDPRITRVGRILRQTSIDELPQLVNVVLGQMSLVGPRPHAISHDDELSRELDVYAHRHRVRPGITGWAQVNGFRGETSQRAQLEGRVEHDLHYIENWSLLFDFWILVLTVFSPMARSNAR